MRVVILGVGGLGRTLASELRVDPHMTSILLIDQHGERARVLTGIRGRVPIEAMQLNIENHAGIVRAIQGADIVINATLPRYNLELMQAALQVRANYLDVAATGPREPGGPPGIFEQLEMDEQFKAQGVTALISFGLDPGISNVMARDAASGFDRVDAIRIRCGDIVSLSGSDHFPPYSREAFLSDILVRPTVWLDGKLEDREPLSEAEEFAFPSPVGVRRTYLVSHEEVKTLPRYLGKPVGRVDYKYALDPNLVRALISLDRLGLLADSRLIRVGNQMVAFRRAMLSAFPEPSALMLPLHGATSLSTEVEGARGSERLVRRGDVTMTHQEANRRRSTIATYYLSAVGAAIGVGLMGDEKAAPGPGVHPPEALDPARVFKEWAARELPLAWSERSLDT
ncbi:MAG TPA: saccharopine dehydrogenase NADP-binding domain-containing protein [Thermoplasmata archaeon]|nr:saccharopine dehydrogenase NADP-binding domain-containing protein [Thermoplasmata archaeon]